MSKDDEKRYLIYEDELPESLLSSTYELWLRHSVVIDGVRMGYSLEILLDNFNN